jgi:hypothetical protein
MVFVGVGMRVVVHEGVVVVEDDRGGIVFVVVGILHFVVLHQST